LDDNFKLIYHHNPHYTHGGLQVADYVAYAVFKYYESGDEKCLTMINPSIGKIQDICNKKYFTRSNPLQLST
jgi:N-acetylglucosamine kinase-like BadF-type ATPase